MKRSNRILAVFASVAFGLAVIIGAVTIVCLFLPANNYTGNPRFGLDFIQALKEYLLVFDFLQSDYDILTQFVALGLLGFGAILALVWLIIGLCRKHFIEILFFFLTILSYAYFSFIFFFGFEYFLVYLETASELKIDEMFKIIIVFADIIFPIVFIFITFIYDMKRMSIKHEAPDFVEAKQYEPDQLFEEMFPEDKEKQYVISDDERARIEKALEEEAERLLEEERKHGPVAPEDVPPVLYEPEPEPEIPPVLYMEDPVEEPLRPEDLPPVLFEPEEPIEEPLRPEDLPPILFMEDPIEEPVVEEEPFDRPACLDNFNDTPEEPYERPACLDRREKPEFEPLPFMYQDFVNREERAQFPPKGEEEIPHLRMFEENYVYEESPAPAPVVKSNGKAYHLSHKDGEWLVKEAGSKIPEAKLPSEEEAIEYVRYNYPGSSIRIHDRNGKIRTI